MLPWYLLTFFVYVGKDIPSAAHVRKSILHGAADHVLRKVWVYSYIHMLYPLKFSPFPHHQYMYCLGTWTHHLIISPENKGKNRENWNAHSHLVSLRSILFRTHYFILVSTQVLYWTKEEDKMEKMKAHLIELYYENLFKVSSLLFCANSVS